MKDVHFVGKINREIFKAVSDDIQTDEVIITDERIKHIKDNHPGDYEKYFDKYAGSIIASPDYIVEANQSKSGLLLKSVYNGEEVFKLVLRVKTSDDDPNYKNSVITFMKIDEKEWNRLIKNKKVLYKRE